jgi:hypothetical protein
MRLVERPDDAIEIGGGDAVELEIALEVGLRAFGAADGARLAELRVERADRGRDRRRAQSFPPAPRNGSSYSAKRTLTLVSDP